MDCVFCRIAAGELPCHLVHRDEHTISFMDINPASRGHLLVLPRAHYRYLPELPAEEAARLMVRITRLSAAVADGLGASGFNVILNNGETAGQVVPHVHFHIIPRYPDDPLRFKARVLSIPPEEMRELAGAIRARLEGSLPG